ncbi:tetratricopeptide repeat protein [Saccharomonospora xinjiangensis]|uniref:Uncharacterized protein n=1 Tax=Saccharomonospora xinjiangensis XJ-54 TaxID=882086 RepID=I0UWS3_9PSEU|nr:tetratricopeptide repeat protein [Saccharomonospora xinjiangensis]EID52326.1 hypothetical protein SacxiDRAFT_0037 [Saccharomonospora xinjiangensis XJ-54]
MIFGALSTNCFHCVDFDVLNGPTELAQFARGVSGMTCPLCGEKVEGYTLLADETDVPTLREGTWNRGAAPAPGFERFFAEHDGAYRSVHDVTEALRGQVSRSHGMSRRDRCAALTRQFNEAIAVIAFDEGRRAHERGDHTLARRAFGIAAGSNDQEVRAHAGFRLGMLDTEEGDVAAAARSYRRASETTVREVRAAALFQVGLSLRELGDADGAQAAFKDCLACEIDFVSGMAAFQCGTLLEERRRTVEARDMYALAVDLGLEGSTEAAINLGALEEAAGRWERARELWAYAFTSKDKRVRASAAFNLGRAWERGGRLRKAKAFYRIAARSPEKDLAERARVYRCTASKMWQPGR